MDTRIQGLRSFLDAAHSNYHAISYLEAQLKQAGYTRLSECRALEEGGKYYFLRGGTAIMAFRIPKTVTGGFLLSAAHSDRPCFKVKENPELVGAYTRLAVERYGGQILSTWMDRPLSVAGRVMVETDSGLESRLAGHYGDLIDRDLLLIPNVAIHMNRNINDGY